MKIRAAILCLIGLGSFAFAAGPINLLSAERHWQTSGAWKVDATAGTAAAAAGEMLAELSSAQSVRLAGRWLSLRVALSGDSPKAGLWLGGVRDSRGEGVRFVIDGATSSITNGRGKTIATLDAAAFSKPLEITFTFTNDKATLHSGGKEIGDLDIQFAEPEATPSLFVERGKAVFSDVLISSQAANAAPISTAPAPAAAAPVKQAAAKPIKPKAVAPAVAVDFKLEKLTPLKSGWQEYFGTHFETKAGPWKTVRQFDGPHFGAPLRDKHTGDVQKLDGPFAGAKVESSLADFRDWQRKDSRGLDENLAQIIRDDRTAIFIAPWVGALGLVQQDQIWALMKIVYGANPGADGRVYFQWGDDINFRRLGTSEKVIMGSVAPRGGLSFSRKINLPEDVVAYAERFFGPAVEAIRAASTEIFRDERHIPVVLGSGAFVGRIENRTWLEQVLDHELEGIRAPSLKGKTVASLVDIITVNYPFISAEGESAMQEIWDRYCTKPGGAKGLWVTEEYGTTTRSPVMMLSRAARFLTWAAKNGLDAQQTRLLWNFPDNHRANDEAEALAVQLAKNFQTSTIRIAEQALDGGTLTRIAAGENKMLLVFSPNLERGAKHGLPFGEVTLEVGDAQAAKPWVAMPLQSTVHRAFYDKTLTVIPVRKDGTKLVLDLGVTSADAWGVLIEAP